MGGRVINEEQAVEFTKIFLNTPFDGGRHLRRINQITQIENGEL
jgi:ribose 5-phosphate isomerase B